MAGRWELINGHYCLIGELGQVLARDGDSAYELAVKAGFAGTVEEWLESLTGPEGEQGPQGPQGPKGDTGEVRFEALTPEQKLSLKGDKGEKGDTGNSGVYIGTDAPTDPTVGVWINPEGDGIPVYAGEVL